MHIEVTSESQPKSLVCACGFRTDNVPEFDDHLLVVRVPLDSIGNDGDKHVPVDPSTPVRWYIPEAEGE